MSKKPNPWASPSPRPSSIATDEGKQKFEEATTPETDESLIEWIWNRILGVQ